MYDYRPIANSALRLGEALFEGPKVDPVKRKLDRDYRRAEIAAKIQDTEAQALENSAPGEMRNLFRQAELDGEPVDYGRALPAAINAGWSPDDLNRMFLGRRANDPRFTDAAVGRSSIPVHGPIQAGDNFSTDERDDYRDRLDDLEYEKLYSAEEIARIKAEAEKHKANATRDSNFDMSNFKAYLARKRLEAGEMSDYGQQVITGEREHQNLEYMTDVFGRTLVRDLADPEGVWHSPGMYGEDEETKEVGIYDALLMPDTDEPTAIATMRAKAEALGRSLPQQAAVEENINRARALMEAIEVEEAKPKVRARAPSGARVRPRPRNEVRQ